MRRLMWAAIGVLVLAASACEQPAPAPPPGPTDAEKVAAADALDQRYLEAFNKQDTDGLMALYWNNPKLVSFSPDGMGTTGWDAAKTGTIEAFKAMPGAKLELLTKHNDVHGDVVLGWGTWRMTVPTPDKPQVMEGRYSDAKMMHDGKWVYVMEHVSVPLPPAPEPVKK
jgi:ketosteroid isomerase-like protein